jgi:TRAP-type C4-dicarboxylate transport system permease small subunit
MFAEWEQGRSAYDLSDLGRTTRSSSSCSGRCFVTVFLQFFTRYVLNDSLAWTEEVARYLLIGHRLHRLGHGDAQRAAISRSRRAEAMPRTMRRWALLLIDLLVFAFGLFMAWTSGQLAMNTRQAMASIEIPKSYVYWIVCAAFVGMSIYAGLRVRKRMRGELSDEPHTLTLD